MLEVPKSAKGQGGTTSYRIPNGPRSLLVEVSPSLFGRSVTVAVGGRVVGRFRKPTAQTPWLEYQLPGGIDKVVLALVCESGSISSHVFLDGRNLRGGETIDAWRSRAPERIDRYEQHIIRGWVLGNDDWAVTLSALIAGAGMTAIALAAEPLLVVIAAALVGATVAIVTVAAWLRIVRRFAMWLRTKPMWNDDLRIEAVFGLAVSPLVALIVLVVVFASNG
jgi:hypothetical protein